MKNRNVKLKFIGITALAAVALIGATLAYFTSHDSVLNIIGGSHVDIELNEEMKDASNPDGSNIPFEDQKNLIPGETVSKIPKITVAQESMACYVRAVITITNPEGAAPAVTMQNIKMSPDWITAQDGTDTNIWYCYYIGGENEGLMKPGDVCEIFSEIEIPGEWTTEMCEKRVTVDVRAEAVQADGFTPEYIRQDGKIVSCEWKNTEGKQIETEKYVK